MILFRKFNYFLFFEQPKIGDWKHQKAVDKAINNIAENAKDIDNVYAQAIASYALQLADHPIKDSVLDGVVSKSINKGKLFFKIIRHQIQSNLFLSIKQ